MAAVRPGHPKAGLICRLVIFDFDGTLADSFPWFKRTINRIAAEHRLQKISEPEIAALRNFDARSIIRRLGVPWWALFLLARQVRKMMTRDIGQIPLFPGAGAMLRQLASRGLTLAIVSSNACRNVRAVLGPENAAVIRYYECGVSVFGKQSKIRKILGASGVERREAIYIGDEIRDGEAARKERIRFGAVSWGYTHAQALQACAPDVLFETMKDITAILGA